MWLEWNIIQIKEINFDILFSSVVYSETTYLFLAVIALKDWNIYSVNVKTIYLYSNLDEEIYSLKQADLSWWQTITKFMLVLEFK